jgi:hypothetical protein
MKISAGYPQRCALCERCPIWRFTRALPQADVSGTPTPGGQARARRDQARARRPTSEHRCRQPYRPATHSRSRLTVVAESHLSDPLADWSPWLPFEAAVQQAPLLPGVYMARTPGATNEVVYVGMAGERRGRGIRGRLTVYQRGRAAVSGLGEAVMDRAWPTRPGFKNAWN